VNLHRLIYFCALGLWLAPVAAEELEAPSYQQAIVDWRASRLAALKGPDGYLNLVGLYWLQPGVSTFGAAPDNDLVFASSKTAYLGYFELDSSGVTMHLQEGAEVRVDGELMRRIFLPDDTTGKNVTATHNSLAWNVVKREGRYAVRLRDYLNPALDALGSIPSYAVSSDWVVKAKFRAYPEPRIARVGTVIEGLGWNPVSPGFVEFEVRGQVHSLEAYDSGTSLFFVFGDRTSGRETYPAGRFLYANLPDPDSTTTLDFNKAYNPPCAFNDFSTCPVASPRNRLAIAVTAGEKYDDELHLATQ
tara:strand:+ start:313 stop:1224 length:912 start_codon:yes stop_codon:yes gene_type:complete